LLFLFHQPSYDRILLDAARRSLGTAKQGDFEIAVVTAHMAAEIVTEQTFTALLQHRRVADLDPVLRDLLPSYSLGNEKVQAVYEALSGDTIGQNAFWERFKRHAVRRKRVVHDRLRVSRDEAEESVAAVSELVNHLRSAVDALGTMGTHGADEV
jgi:hypothetical protein